MWELMLANIRSRKFRLVSTGLSVVIGIAFFSGSTVLTDTIGRTFDDLIVDVNEGTDVVVRGADLVESGFNQVRSRVDQDLADDIAAVDGVDAIAPVVQGYAQLIDHDGEAVGDPSMGPPTLGLNWVEDEQLSQMNVVEGAAPSGPSDIVIDRYTADENGFAVGDEVTVLLQVGPEPFTIAGIATFGDSDSLLGATVTLFPLDTAQRVLGVSGMVDSFAVASDGSVSQSELRGRIAAILPSSAEAITGQESIDEAQEQIADALSFFTTFMTVFAVIALFVAAFIVYNTFAILVAQRKRETGLMRALGAGRRQVVGAVLLEAVAVGIVASLIGLAGGLAVAQGLKSLLGAVGFAVPASGLVFQMSTVVNSMIVGVTVAAVSAIIPAVRSSRVSPMAALRAAAVDSSEVSLPRNVFGAVALAAGVAALFYGLYGDSGQALLLVGVGAAAVFIGVAALGPAVARPFASVAGRPVAALRGLPGEVARENSMRNPKRMATTAAALMVGVGLVSAISIFAASTTRSVDKIIDESVVGDLVIDSGSQGFGGLSPELASQLDALPEVEAASGVRLALVEIEGDATTVIAFDPSTMEELIDVGSIDGDPTALGPNEIALHEAYAEDNGWSLGSVIDIHFVDTGDQEFVVGAVYAEDTLIGDLFISNEAYEANNLAVFDIAVYLSRSADSTPEAFRASVESVAAAYPNADVQDLEEVKDSISAQVDQMLSLVYALLALSVLIALLGIANALALSIVERTREIGLLRAVGMTRPQLRAAVRWESFLISLLGTTLGFGTGLFFGWALVQALEDEGITELVVPLTSSIVVVVLATLAGVAASIRPARRAARMKILGALAVS